MVLRCLICAGLAAAPTHRLISATAGWEDVNPARTEVPPADVVWSADASSPANFKFETRQGAKGSVSFSCGKIRIEKTNAEGYLVLKAKPFGISTNEQLRISADVEVVADNPDCAYGFLRAHGATEDLRRDFKAEKGNFSSGGSDSMLGMRNSPPHTPYRKYAHFIAQDGIVTPVILVGGPPSSSTWSNWTFERVSAAQKAWANILKSKAAKDNVASRMEEVAFNQLIASDVEHTAEVKTIGGVSRLLVDDEIVLPVAYSAKTSFGCDAGRETFHGDVLARNGIGLMIREIKMGGRRGDVRRYWTGDGFDAEGAAQDFKEGMRLAPQALFVLRLSCNAYPEYTQEHPEEVWRTETGLPVFGTDGSCVVGYDDMGIPDTNRWPWVSYSSRRWREDVKANIRALVAEFRRQGLDKRIVGIHLCGYHDGQFSAPYPDYSECAKREYQAYLSEQPVYTNYLYFVKQCGFRAQEEFAREFKRSLGKKAVAFRYCMGMFSASERGNYDITAFANSDAIDIIVPQAPYERRHPGLALGPKLPQASFNLHGKMFWYEFDLRTYGALESWATSVVATKGLGQLDDFTAWQTAYRKLAGVMMALRSGFWFYDMGGGWYSPPEIASDIDESLRTMGTFALRKPSPWRPNVAVVLDEANPAVFGNADDLLLPLRHEIAARDCNRFAASGVPYESYIAEDVLDRPDRLKHAKMVVLSLFRAFDGRRLAFVRRLMEEGKTIAFLAESGVVGGDVEATGFKTVFDRSKRAHRVVAAEGVLEDCSSPLDADYTRVYSPAKTPHGMAIGPRVTVVETPDITVVARYSEDGAPAVVYREENGCRRIYVAEHQGFVPALFNRFARDAGAYVPHAGTGLQVDMNGDFISVHALRSGHFDFTLPFPATVMNLKSGREEPQWNGRMVLELTAGETCWFRLDPPVPKRVDDVQGWDNQGSTRRLSDPGRAVVWHAPFAEGAKAFTVEKRFGAEGIVLFDGDSVTIDKTNDLGVIVVRPNKPYVASGPRELRTAVREECENARPLESDGAVYLYGGEERLSLSSFDWKHWGAGGVRNSKVLNTAPGVAEWKYGYDCASETNGCRVTPAIRVGGAACRTRWSDWRIEDGLEIAREWREIVESKKSHDRMADTVSSEAFKKMLADDFDHVAKVEVKEGKATLFVDGRESLPVFYKSRAARSVPGGFFRNCHAGRGMNDAGVRLQSMPVSRHWWPDGRYGLAAAIREIDAAMRTAPDSLFVMALELLPYERFAEDYPSERWIGYDGMIVCGGDGGCKKAVKPGERWPKGMVPCTSMFSTLWRDTVTNHISQLVAELRRTDLAKRIVGVHLMGFHDKQFSASNFPDFSPSALSAYRRYTGEANAEIPVFSGNALLDPASDEAQRRWIAFVKTEPCRVQNDIARHIKKCFGKDVIAVRWSYGPYSGNHRNDYDTCEFLHSDALDILVAQQAYGNRGPAIPFANKMPFESYHRHGKIYVDELDFRTWNLVNGSEVGQMGLGCSMDLPMWKAAFRRAVGRMAVGGMGWWLYDMENGWFDHPAILADVADTLKTLGTMPHGGRVWHPSVAIVIDERNILENVNLVRRRTLGDATAYRDGNETNADLSAHLPKFAASGVPYDIWLSDDVLGDPSIAARYKAIAWTCCVCKDERRVAFEREFTAKGGRILFRDDLCWATAESFNRFARESGAYVPINRSGVQIDMNGSFISLHCIIPGHYDFHLPYTATVVNLKTGRSVETRNGILPLDLAAGETRWYGLSTRL